MDRDTSDENLMLDYCSGDADAFDVLYQRHKGPLYRFVLRQCGARFVDELFQDLWFKVINARSDYSVQAAFKTWLYRIARNRIIDHYRRQNIRPIEISPESLAAVADCPATQPERALQAQHRHASLVQAIADLPHQQKEAFLLREEAGLGIEDIARTTGVSFETAKSRLRYAVRKLRQKLEAIDD